MEVQAVLISTFLSAQEELAEFGGAKGCTNQSVLVHELIDRKDGLGTVTRIVERNVAGVGGTTSTTIVNIVCVYDNLLDFAVLSE